MARGQAGLIGFPEEAATNSVFHSGAGRAAHSITNGRIDGWPSNRRIIGAFGYRRMSAGRLADGVESDQEDVLQRCVAAEPAHGELWTSISKDPAHARADVAAKLRLAAAKIRASEDAT